MIEFGDGDLETKIKCFRKALAIAELEREIKYKHCLDATALFAKKESERTAIVTAFTSVYLIRQICRVLVISVEIVV